MLLSWFFWVTLPPQTPAHNPKKLPRETLYLLLRWTHLVRRRASSIKDLDIWIFLSLVSTRRGKDPEISHVSTELPVRVMRRWEWVRSLKSWHDVMIDYSPNSTNLNQSSCRLYRVLDRRIGSLQYYATRRYERTRDVTRLRKSVIFSPVGTLFESIS